MNKLGVLSIVSVLTMGLNPNPVTADEKPPTNAKLLSEVARAIEQRADFQAFEGIEFDDGVYKAEYYTKDGAKKEIRLDPVSGTEQK